MKRKVSTVLAAVLAVLFLVIFGGPTEEAPQPEAPSQSQTVQLQVPIEAPTEAPAQEPTAQAPPAQEPPAEEKRIPEVEAPPIDEDGSYTKRDDVALYIHTYGRLPDNFITKEEARDLGWEGGGLEDYAPGKCIGGDRFGNYEGLLPKAKGRSYTECDIDTLGKSKRGAKRIVFSNDGLIYYTSDHYESFELLYGEP